MVSIGSATLAHLAGLMMALGVVDAFGFDLSRNDNVVAYWGQNSFGGGGGAKSGWQQPIDFYCQDDSIDVFPVAFVDAFFAAGGLPSLDLANICGANTNPVFPGTELPDCSFLAPAIKSCQSKGKIVTISVGGATGAIGFSSDQQASAFADTIWNLFLGGSSSTRPLGDAVLDGIDLDIEGGSGAHYDVFVQQLRSHMNNANKKYYITAAPQCFFPDAFLGTVFNEVAFDALYVQFYNNFCELTTFGQPNAFNFDVWDNWAKTTSANKNVKIYLGAPASSTAAGAGYVPIDKLTTIIQSVKAQYSSFGGVMYWDASQAFNNNRFDVAVKAAVRDGSSAPAPPPSSPTTPSAPTTPTTHTTTSLPTTSLPTTSLPTTTSTPAQTPPATNGSCAGVGQWVVDVAYNAGQQVVSNSHLWTAKWWSFGDTPGGPAGDWTDNGACTTTTLKVSVDGPKRRTSRLFYSA